MTGRRAFRWAPLAGTAGIGVMAGHWLSYDVAIPGAGLRSEILAATGHSWWEFGLKAMALLAVVGLGALIASRMTSRPDAVGVDRWSFVATRLIPLQLVAFLGMEAAERLAVGAPLGGLLDHHVLLIGLAFQVITAVAGAVLLTWFDRAVVRVAAAIHSRRSVAPSRPRSIALPSPVLVPTARRLAGAVGLRGPPRS